MIRVLSLFGVICLIGFSTQISTPQDDHYWAGVVEFSYAERWNGSESAEVYTAKNLAKYKEIINSAEADPVDILVFPEYGLSAVETASFVPNPEDRIAPCNNLEYEQVVRDLSCLARQRQKYLVVNLVEKARCPDKNEWRPCAKNGLYHFNSNVVFDRHGFVIARYRKFNLFGEAGINVTTSADVTQFETDFGVTFGTFICFDLMFEQPALQLVRNGVTDIIFSTMWFSELPFLTGVQIQQAWAYKNNVNFLASGASFPEVGSTGTGVFAGKRGRIVAVMNYHAESKLYVAQVPKINRPQATITRQPRIQFNPADMKHLKLKRDQIDGYFTEKLPAVSGLYNSTLCQNKLCCSFLVNYTVSKPANIANKYYSYRLAVSDRKRTFDGFADGLITTCSIFACTGEELSSCSTRFELPDLVVNAFQFNSIEIGGEFPGGQDVFLLPNSVDTSIMPLEVDEIEYSEKLFTKDGQPFKRIEYNLVKPRSDLYTFAIWGRKFLPIAQSGQSAVAISSLLVLLAAVCVFLVK